MSIDPEPIEPCFTSLDGGHRLRSRLLELIGEAASLSAAGHVVDLHVMTFSFTDEQLAAALLQGALGHPAMSVRLLADWSQSVGAHRHQAARLAALDIPNLHVRYKLDQPYVWDAELASVRWSYHASRGLLHHKTLGVLVGRRPWKLVCGSFNWTAAGRFGYENLLVVDASTPPSREVMWRVELEFEALWSDGRASLSPGEADLHHARIVDSYRRDPGMTAAEVVGIGRGAGCSLHTLPVVCRPTTAGATRTGGDRIEEQPEMRIAFSSRLADEQRGASGYSEVNRAQRFVLRKLSGRSKVVPVTLTTLALDAIGRAEPGDTLKIAMYGLSVRVPEYGALLNAARRDVRLLVLLDRTLAGQSALSLLIAAAVEHLPIEVRVIRRTMHQKYVIHEQSATILTGTANMSTDSSARHTEHRLLVRGYPAATKRFAADFDEIWARASGSSLRHS